VYEDIKMTKDFISAHLPIANLGGLLPPNPRVGSFALDSC
jgi:hypothetical protein